MLISQVWKFARRSNVCSALKIFRKISCVRSSASSWRPDELVGQVEDLAPVLADDLIPRRLIAGEAPLDERFRAGGRRDVFLCGHRCGECLRIIANRAGLARRRVQWPVPVAGFHTTNGELTCDEVRIRDLTRETGTPVHVYSGTLITERYEALDRAYAGYPHRLHYAIKANATIGIVRHLRALGAAADANSGGEIEVALRAGLAPHDIVFTGVGKTGRELERAVALGVAAINAESPGEVDRIAAIAHRLGRKARVAVRINPDVDALTHPHISTGTRATKFGMSVDDARTMVLDMARRPDLEVVGLHVHVGSQVTKREPLERAAETVAALARELISAGVKLEHLDLGGGLGIAYETGQHVLSADDYAAAILPAVRTTGLTLVLEPGRAIVGPAGILVTEVVDLKKRPNGGWFVITDAGMTDLLRPALYGALHAIEAVTPRPGTPWRVDVVGPVCETSDTLGADRELPPVDVGDLLAVRDTGAYGAVMASNYNRRPMAAEVLVNGTDWMVIRRRQTVNDLLMWDD